MRLMTLLAGMALAMGLATQSGAATVNTVVDFETGGFVGDTFVQDGFVFTSIKSGSGPVSIPSGQCIDDECLNIRNKESIKLTFTGGVFDLLSFYFNTDGNGSGVIVSATLDGPGQLFAFNQGGQPFTLATLSPAFLGVTELFFKHADNGTVRIDNLGLAYQTAAIPLPAAGWLMVAGLGALGLTRRRRKAV